MKWFNVKMEGVTAFLQSQVTEETMEKLQKRSRKAASTGPQITPAEQAKKGLHISPDGFIVHPGEAIVGMLKEQSLATGLKMTGSRRGVGRSIAGWVDVPEWVNLYEPAWPDKGEWDGIAWRKATHFSIDIRSGVNPKTQMRCAIIRPRLDSWQIRFEMGVDDHYIGPDAVRELLVGAGVCIGIGDFRVENSGRFGKFEVLTWEPIKAPSIGRGKTITPKSMPPSMLSV